MSINLIIQSYPVKNEIRNAEILYCLRENLKNSAVRSIHDIMEPGVILPDDIINHPKFVGSVIDTTRTKKTSERFVYRVWFPYPKILDTQPELNDLSKRLTFKYAFEYIKDNFKDGEIVVICNDDIKFEDSEAWRNINTSFFMKERLRRRTLSLSRHEGDMEGNIWKDYGTSFRMNCSDAWVFKTPILDMENTNFCSGGIPTCDQAIGQRMLKAGYQVFNMADVYKIIHIDRLKNGVEANRPYMGIWTDWSFPGLDDDGTWVCPMFAWEKCLNLSMKFDKLCNHFRNCPSYEHTHNIDEIEKMFTS